MNIKANTKNEMIHCVFIKTCEKIVRFQDDHKMRLLMILIHQNPDHLKWHLNGPLS